jgi:anti-sigma factor RsiW
MRCKKFKERMERYSDTVLSARKKSACEEHLATCLNCRQAYVDFNEMKSLLTATPLPPAPADLTADIMRSVRNLKALANNRTENILIQWWKESAVPVRLAFSVVLFIIVSAGVFAGKDLWSASASKGYSEYTEFDTYSKSQQGSLENVYFQLIQAPTQGGKQ